MIPKFRVWHKDGKVMLSNYLGFMITDAGQLLIESMLGDETTMEKVKFDNYIVMQSTGLKDKNGVEIFEGDIVEYAGRANNHGVPWGWEFTTFGKGVVKYNLVGYSVFDLHTDNLIKEDLNELLIRYEEIDIKVIGNVYENSELLEEQNK